MFDIAILMLDETMTAFEKEDTALARSIYKEDELLDEINLSANEAVSDFIKANLHRVNQSLYLLSAILKLERVGDQCKNIVEEIIFFVEASVLKHSKKGKTEGEEKA